MRANPKDGWAIDDVRVVCNAFDIDLLNPSSGSHYKVSHPSQREILTIPCGRPIKPVYIRRLVDFIDAVRNAENDHEA